MTPVETLARLREHHCAVMDGIVEAPGMFGSPESQELQFLMALETVYQIDCPDDLRPRVIMDSWIAYIHRVLDGGNLPMYAILAKRGTPEALPEHLRAFRAYVEGRIAARREKTP
mgnify:FL=1